MFPLCFMKIFSYIWLYFEILLRFYLCYKKRHPTYIVNINCILFCKNGLFIIVISIKNGNPAYLLDAYEVSNNIILYLHIGM